MIHVDHVIKKYGKIIANNNISMQVRPGEMAVLLGPNGAGKSTLIKCICGLLRFEGHIHIFGHENHSVEAKSILGYIPEVPSLYGMLTVYEHMQFIAKAYKLESWEDKADSLLKQFELDDKKLKLGKELSKGMQQKVSICCALLTSPKAIIFDEPFVGLDPHAIRELKATILRLKSEGSALLVSTHMIDTMEGSWDTTYIMKNGEIMRECKHSDIEGNASLEDLFFAITENGGGEEVN